MTNAYFEPVVAFIAGLLIFAMPRLLNYIVATYLVITGLVGVLGAVNGTPAPAVPAVLIP
jgi:hypothetical protein